MRSIMILLVLLGSIFAAVEYFDHCITIDESGSYTLVSDIEYTGDSSCIRIDASSVTLNCGEHRIMGSYPSSAIRIHSGEKNIFINDCKIGFFKYGIYAEDDVGNLYIENAEIDSCEEGISLHNGRDTYITYPRLTNNDVGVRFNTWIRGELTNGYFSNRDYGVILTSTRESLVDSSEFTDSVYGIYTEGICSDTVISGNTFHSLVTPIDLYGASAMIKENTFHTNAGYALLIRESQNSFEDNHIYYQPNYFATQSNAFTFIRLLLGDEGTPGSMHFREFASRKPFTTTKFYYFNDSNVRSSNDMIAIEPQEYIHLVLEDVTVWLDDPNAENDTAVFQADPAQTSRSTILQEGVALAEPVPVESSPGVFSFTLAEFNGSYAIGERPPESDENRYVIIIVLEAPSSAETNEEITVEARDQDGDVLGNTAIYYFDDPSAPVLAGYTNPYGTLTFSIPTEGAFVIQGKYNEITSQRAIAVSAPSPEPEPEPEVITEIPEPEPVPVAEPEPEPQPQPEPEPYVPPEEPQQQLDNNMLLFAGAGFIIVLAIVAAAILFFPKKPPTGKPEAGKYKKFREKH